MGMNVGSGGGDDEPMVEMNTTPLIDVMLVLLIMLIITIPRRGEMETLSGRRPQNDEAPTSELDGACGRPTLPMRASENGLEPRRRGKCAVAKAS
ncbi:MAG: hypothetical protein C4K60_07590 [Ideonella sp. MAG2]|nr:MAG: hypothetical protein C4K60_07590 [Ideonella sp. MAG2]